MLTSDQRSALETLTASLKKMYDEHADGLPFHGWHHVSFVRRKALQFAEENGANRYLVEVAALVHDLNYIARRASDAAAGAGLRSKVLTESGVGKGDIATVECIVQQAETADRVRDVSVEVQALSDADTLFKALPITPIVLAPRYLEENGYDLRRLAKKITIEQGRLMREEYYFYSEKVAHSYRRWAEANLALWACVEEALDDADVIGLLQEMGVGSA